MTETAIDKPRTFELLRARGIVKVEVSFSGGNDEGGADGYAAYLADGTAVELGVSRANEWPTGTWTVWERDGQRPATQQEIDDSILTDLLEAPVYAEYGGFSGDFSVSGTVTWDVIAGTVHMDRSEQMWGDAPSLDF